MSTHVIQNPNDVIDFIGHQLLAAGSPIAAGYDVDLEALFDGLSGEEPHIRLNGHIDSAIANGWIKKTGGTGYWFTLTPAGAEHAKKITLDPRIIEHVTQISQQRLTAAQQSFHPTFTRLQSEYAQRGALGSGMYRTAGIKLVTDTLETRAEIAWTLWKEVLRAQQIVLSEKIRQKVSTSIQQSLTDSSSDLTSALEHIARSGVFKQLPQDIVSHAITTVTRKIEANLLLESLAPTSVGISHHEASTADLSGQSSPLPSPMPDTRKVFVIHGRNEPLRTALFDFLRAINLDPIEWSQARVLTKQPTPSIGDILDAGFKAAQAFVVLLSPDDEVRLAPELLRPDDETPERELRRQARPNVLFEAGMAWGKNMDRTVLVQFGRVKSFSDIAGRHVLKLNNSPQARKELAQRLQTAGCDVKLDGNDWLSTGDFAQQVNAPVRADAPNPITTPPSVKVVDVDYPEHSGLSQQLRDQGYILNWSAEDELARRLDLEGWSLVYAEDAQGNSFILQVKDPSGPLTLIKRAQRGS